VRQAFLETSHSAGTVSLLRYYDDEGSAVHCSTDKPSQRRPFLQQEAQFPVSVNLPGTDQRGIVIDDSPRLQCKAQAALNTRAAATPDGPQSPDFVNCGQLPARVFIGSRTPPSVVFGYVGGNSLATDGTLDPDQVRFKASVPVGDEQGVSRLYLAPIVDRTGHYDLRLFVVLFDASTVWVFNPDDIERLGQGALPEAILSTGPGPFAMAFDPFCTGLVKADGTPLKSLLDPGGTDDCARYGALSDVAVSEVAGASTDPMINQSYLVPADPRAPPAFGLRSYRFGYVAIFTNSFLQVLDLDDSLFTLPNSTTPSHLGPRSQQTFESFVFTLGNPTPPLGS
jgi:hypothetical protein